MNIGLPLWFVWVFLIGAAACVAYGAYVHPPLFAGIALGGIIVKLIDGVAGVFALKSAQ